MKVYIITFNSTDSSALTQVDNYIRTFPTWAKLSLRTWIIKSELKASEVRDVISSQVGPGVKVAVFDITNSSWATYRHSDVITNWLKDSL